jgi:hypothetical protein
MVIEHAVAVRKRAGLGAASLGAAAAGMLVLGAQDWSFGGKWLALGSSVVGLASYGLTRRGIVAQVLSRGVAWVVLAPMLVGWVFALYAGHSPGFWAVFMTASPAAALLLARPALHTDEALHAFCPARHRRLFLAGAVACTTAGLLSALVALATGIDGVSGASVGLSALAMGLLGSGLGVARMRTWGVLLGAVTSAATVVAALLATDGWGALALTLAALPGLLLAVTVVVARRSVRSHAAADRVRFSTDSTKARVEEREGALSAVRARIGTVAECDGGELLEARERAREADVACRPV